MHKNQDITYNATCPFCSLLCDDLVIEYNSHALRLKKNGCVKADSVFKTAFPESRSAQVDGKDVSFERAISKICEILRGSKMPLISGLGTESGAIKYALHLADNIGAVVDHMHNRTLSTNTFALQDSGWMTTTMSEVKNRADLIIFAGTDARQFPRLYERIISNCDSLYYEEGIKRKIICIGTQQNTEQTGSEVQVLQCAQTQIIEVIASLHALAEDQTLDTDSIAGIEIKALQDISLQMKAAQYGVIIWSSADFAESHAELTVQRICDLVRALNKTTRFSGFPLSSGDGAITANNICNWQTGYPLPINFNEGYPRYEPYLCKTSRLLEEKQVDSLLWISSFSSDAVCPKQEIPTIMLTRSDTLLDFQPDVFIPVSTPGIDDDGFLFRTDNIVALPLKKLRESVYPSVRTVLKTIIENI